MKIEYVNAEIALKSIPQFHSRAKKNKNLPSI
jgi:hypothetical protein